MMLKNSIELIGTIQSLSHDGRGICHTDDGKTTFISGALPFEVVKFKLTKKHSRYNEAQVVEILESSSERTTPVCQHFGICGGCTLQHLNMQGQIALKQKTLLENLQHFGHVTPKNILPPLHKSEIGYRRKARLGVRYVLKKEKMLIGFREKSSRYLAELTGCDVLHESVGKKFSAITELLLSLIQYQHIAQIEVAVGDHDTALVFRHLESLPESDLEKLRNFGQQHNFHIYLQPNSPATISKLWPDNTADRLSYSLKDYDLELLFHPLDFTQVNSEINPLMIKQALQLLELNSTDHVLDLFCGLGNFTLPIAKFAKHVTGIEVSQAMILRARDNSKHNGLSNTEFYAANLDATDLDIPWLQQKFNKILLDPPRSGAMEIIKKFPQLKPERIVYVSCNPATLARDAGELVNQQKYKLTQVGVINMFPHTSHIEAMALFEK